MGYSDWNGVYHSDEENAGCLGELAGFVFLLICFFPLIYGVSTCVDPSLQFIVDGKANNKITGRYSVDKDYRIVLTFESTGCDSIVYNTIKIGDTLDVYNIHSDYWGSDNNWGHGKRKFPNNGQNIRYINNKSIPQLKEYERYKKQQAKATARSNLGK